MTTKGNLVDWDDILDRCVRFAQRLIQTPSLPGHEAGLAELVATEMGRLSFDEVWIDEVGNVGGVVHGRERRLGAVVLNSHLDHVDPGEIANWPHPPYGGIVTGGRIHGRGACDIKGPLATQLYGLGAILASGQRPRRDVYFSGVVQEETGGAGARFWAENLEYPVDLLVLGEPSSNNLSLGHRGIIQLWVRFEGRSVHASVPSKGHNPNYDLANFLLALETEVGRLKRHPLLGPTTVAPTIIEVDTTSPNVTPAWTRVLLDFRTAIESPNNLLDLIDRLAGGLKYSVSDSWISEANSAVGQSDEPVVGFYTPVGPLVERIRELIGSGTGLQPELVSYDFATDGRLIAPLGIPVVGYSPGEESLAHTVNESIAIDMMADGLRGYYHLLLSF